MKFILRGGDWDGFAPSETLIKWWNALTMEPKPAGSGGPGIDYHLTDEWEGERRVYRSGLPNGLPEPTGSRSE